MNWNIRRQTAQCRNLNDEVTAGAVNEILENYLITVFILLCSTVTDANFVNLKTENTRYSTSSALAIFLT